MKFSDVSLEDAQGLREKVLRKPDVNMQAFAKRLRDSCNSASLPLSFEMMLIDFSSEDIVKEMIQFYCENATLQLELLNGPDDKRKNNDETKPVKMIKEDTQRRSARLRKS